MVLTFSPGVFYCIFGLKLEHWRFQSITNRFRSIDLLKDDPLLKLGVNFGRHLLELGNSARGSVG